MYQALSLGPPASSQVMTHRLIICFECLARLALLPKLTCFFLYFHFSLGLSTFLFSVYLLFLMSLRLVASAWFLATGVSLILFSFYSHFLLPFKPRFHLLFILSLPALSILLPGNWPFRYFIKTMIVKKDMLVSYYCSNNCIH